MAVPAPDLVALRELGDRVRPLSAAAERVLPVPAAFADLIPQGGLVRGSTVITGGSAASSLALALAGPVTAAGQWCAVVGVAHLGLLAAAELGVALERTLLIADPGPQEWAGTVAALLDAVEVVVVQPTAPITPTTQRRLIARARDRGSVLLQAGGRSDAWAAQPDLTVDSGPSRWEGVGIGHGRLRARRVRVQVSGRRGAVRPREAELWLPGPEGQIAVAAPGGRDRRRPPLRTGGAGGGGGWGRRPPVARSGDGRRAGVARRGMTAEVGTRTLVVWCPDWPVLASDPEPAAPVIVVRANRVVAASMAARAAGVEVGLRRRAAQRRCPSVEVVAHDPGRDARAFEPVASSLDAVTPGVEVSRPGTLAFATRGPSRYFGGDESLAERVAWMVSGALGGRWPVRVGVADGAFGALLAAQAAHRRGVATVVVPPGEAAGFLGPHPVASLLEAVEVPDVIDVWQRLGLRTLRHVAELPRGDVSARFGHPGVAAHRLASGLDLRPLAARHPAPDLAVTRDLDPPVDRVDRAAFVAKTLADQLHARLAADGLACTQVLVEARTEHGEVLARRWRHEGALTAGALADRVRWQLDGWLTGSGATRPTAGVDRLTLVPVEVVAARGRQLGFWGGETLVDERIWRAVARLQGQLGAEAVTVPEVRGGRGPGERVVRVPVATVDLTEDRPAARPASITEPWPGQVPAPAPATVLAEPEPVVVADARGRPVTVSGRIEVSAPPATLALPGRRPVRLTAWAGPWPVDERWWDPERHRRRARFQVVDQEGAAHLLAVEAGAWWREATYD